MKTKNIMIAMGIMTLFILIIMYFGKQQVNNTTIANSKINQYSYLQVIRGGEELPLKSPIDLAVGKDGILYVTDSDNHRIQVFDEQGNYLTSYGGFGTLEGQFNYPVSIALDSQDNAYIVDLLNHRIQVFDRDGNFLKYLVESNTNSHVIFPTGVAIDSNDDIYVIDKFDHKIKKINSNGDMLNSFGGFGSANDQLNYPLSMAINSVGDIIVSDTGNGRVQVFTKDGNYKFSFEGYFSAPSGLAVGSNDRLFISDPMNGRVILTSYWGELEETVGSLGVLSTELYFPEGLEVFGKKLYIADKGNNRVVIYSLK